ncbi:MAG: molecular chaperone DnaJ [Bacteroidetes bacterium GWE2_41_25]|nr:MAG: molecular chaperone DnaJ [Bacteroidetes bacterium GWA2_40_15]OFX93345.1 MAG: molecular chaperone DnaJ [Bacteroidetes bacterium GWE2_41_25]OFX97800.1 MAG: molecular chaperone DnaJ [Bacteroidetes bacterium GWC2_40_22]OFY60805.1 MAG: molecular chaperone DnaJ [Bacteroidetes bacterium GWF2_41_9]HAM10267.1 molecular chaperone DnaJ [Bacteroidales bacterium]
MIFLDYYKILGLNKTATAKDVKSAYRKLARKYHPDLNPNDKEAKKNFQQINEANEVLSDPVKRKKYDQYGKDWKHAEEFEKAKQYQEQTSDYQHPDYSGTQMEGDFSDFFESLFGGSAGAGRSSHVKYRGKDFNAGLKLDLRQAYKTHKQTLTVNGKTIRITIPAGIENGQTIKISAHGGPGVNGGPNGDLYITFSITNQSDIKRLGSDLYIKVDLDLFKAILGGEITIDTLKGKVKLKVKPETQNGCMIKLKGMGFPVYKNEGHFGDLIVTYTIKIPTNLTDKQKELFTELSGL